MIARRDLWRVISELERLASTLKACRTGKVKTRRILRTVQKTLTMLREGSRV